MKICWYQSLTNLKFSWNSSVQQLCTFIHRRWNILPDDRHSSHIPFNKHILYISLHIMWQYTFIMFIWSFFIDINILSRMLSWSLREATYSYILLHTLIYRSVCEIFKPTLFFIIKLERIIKVPLTKYTMNLCSFVIWQVVTRGQGSALTIARLPYIIGILQKKNLVLFLFEMR